MLEIIRPISSERSASWAGAPTTCTCSPVVAEHERRDQPFAARRLEPFEHAVHAGRGLDRRRARAQLEAVPARLRRRDLRDLVQQRARRAVPRAALREKDHAVVGQLDLRRRGLPARRLVRRPQPGLKTPPGAGANVTSSVSRMRSPARIVSSHPIRPSTHGTTTVHSNHTAERPRAQTGASADQARRTGARPELASPSPAPPSLPPPSAFRGSPYSHGSQVEPDRRRRDPHARCAEFSHVASVERAGDDDLLGGVEAAAQPRAYRGSVSLVAGDVRPHGVEALVVRCVRGRSCRPRARCPRSTLEVRGLDRHARSAPSCHRLVPSGPLV